MLQVYLEGGLFFISSIAFFAFSAFRQARITLAPKKPHVIYTSVFKSIYFIYIVVKKLL